MKDKLIEKLKEYLKYILKYACVTEAEKSIRMTRFESEIASLESELAKEEPEGVTAEEYIKNNWGENWLSNQWEAGDVVDALEEFASSKQIDLSITDADIEAWAEMEFGDAMIIPETAAFMGAKAMRDGEIKHLNNL